jgi:drug/metabolite transporter (DMT)-like permease
MSNDPEPSANPRRLWPWFVLAGVLLGAVLAFLWVSAEVRRIKSIERFDYRPSATNAPAGR